MPADRRFRAMGTDCHIQTVGGSAAHLQGAIDRVADLERRWSRFRTDSEISQLNRNAGWPTIVSPETFELVAKAVNAWSVTDGRFDPTVLHAMAANGYDRSFDLIDHDHPRPATGSRSPGCADIQLSPSTRSVRLPHGVGIDPGGIGKGLAADLVARELLDAGACGALVNLGGDVRVIGEPPTDDGWVIEIEDPSEPDKPLARISLRDAAVATSSTQRRRWTRADQAMHHIVDPETGRPTTGPILGVSIIAAAAWWAEALTKAVMIAGDLSPVHHATAVAVCHDGTHLVSPELQEVCA